MLTKVYNLEVENENVYYANGLLVHNCEFCAPMEGKIIAVGDDYFDKDSSFKGRDGGKITFNYESIQHPPLHPRCRCSLAPAPEEKGIELTREEKLIVEKRQLKRKQKVFELDRQKLIQKKKKLRKIEAKKGKELKEAKQEKKQLRKLKKELEQKYINK